MENLEMDRRITNRREADRKVCPYHWLMKADQKEVRGMLKNGAIEHKEFATKNDADNLWRDVKSKADWKVTALLVIIVLGAFSGIFYKLDQNTRLLHYIDANQVLVMHELKLNPVKKK